ncbi:MAG TPA: endolytic transglycosylase MltG [Gemmatimonadales bacterium]|nr:endolytic transglycosylase MltG [Gemmatimonadales bacterium]
MKGQYWILSFCLAAFGCGGRPSLPCDAAAADCVALTIPRGATLGAAIDSLSAHDLVARQFLFSIYARVRGLGRDLKSGTYAFRQGTRWNDIIDALKLGRGALVRFTVREGLRIVEIADQASQELGVPRDSFLAAARDTAVIAKLGLSQETETLEGYLYPTTYTIQPHPTARQLVRVMTDEFQTHWSTAWDARLDSLHFSRQQLITLASIIESEVRYAPDRTYVSAVYHNRLDRGMMLQADPTVIYAMGARPRRVYEKNLFVRSPYNTYLHAGLPPGPISQPDSASIDAALYPAAAPYLYFVAQPDGKHIFSASYTEHLAAIRDVKEQQSEIRSALSHRQRDP